MRGCVLSLYRMVNFFLSQIKADCAWRGNVIYLFKKCFSLDLCDFIWLLIVFSHAIKKKKKKKKKRVEKKKKNSFCSRGTDYLHHHFAIIVISFNCE